MSVHFTGRSENVFAPELGYLTCAGCLRTIERHDMCDGVGKRVERASQCPPEECQNGARRSDHTATCPDREADEVRSAQPARLAEIARGSGQAA